MSFLFWRHTPSVPRYLKIETKSQKKTLMWGGVLTERFRIYIYTICWQSHVRVVGVAHHQHDVYLYKCVFVLLYNEFFLETRSNLSVPKYFSYVLTKPKKTLMLGGGF